MAQVNSTKALLVYPTFSKATFWNYTVACELVGPLSGGTAWSDHARRYVAADLGHPARQPQH